MSPFLLRTNGGPLDGETRVVDPNVMPWPFPDELSVEGGVYRKVSESQLPSDAAANPHVGVGAEYEWVES